MKDYNGIPKHAKRIEKPKSTMPCYGDYLPGPGCDQCPDRWHCLRTACVLDREVERHHLRRRRIVRHDPAYEPEEVA